MCTDLLMKEEATELCLYCPSLAFWHKVPIRYASEVSSGVTPRLPYNFRGVCYKGSRSLILGRTIRKGGSFQVSSENHTCSRGCISRMRCLFEVFLGSNQSWKSRLLRNSAIRSSRTSAIFAGRAKWVLFASSSNQSKGPCDPL